MLVLLSCVRIAKKYAESIFKQKQLCESLLESGLDNLVQINSVTFASTMGILIVFSVLTKKKGYFLSEV
jgi:hypothetical protein